MHLVVPDDGDLHSEQVQVLTLRFCMQARTLMTLTYAFYSDPVSFLHVHNFNHSPAEFNFADLAKELGIGSDTPAL